MPKLRSLVSQTLESMGGSSSEFARARRAAAVRSMWEQLMRQSGDTYILEHTNNVFILQADEARPLRRDHDDRKDAARTGTGQQLIAYVDESIVAAELNARRELVKFQFHELFGEEIDEFKIIISRGQYKHHHPFAEGEQAPSYLEDVEPAPLSPEELAQVEAQLAAIENEGLRKAVRRAMVADLEWKKAL